MNSMIGCSSFIRFLKCVDMYPDTVENKFTEQVT